MRQTVSVQSLSPFPASSGPFFSGSRKRVTRAIWLTPG